MCAIALTDLKSKLLAGLPSPRPERSQALLSAAAVSSHLNLASACFAGGRFPRDISCLGFLSFFPEPTAHSPVFAAFEAVPASRGKGQLQCSVPNALDKRVLPVPSVSWATSSTTKPPVEKKMMGHCKYHSLKVSRRQVDMALQ